MLNFIFPCRVQSSRSGRQEAQKVLNAILNSDVVDIEQPIDSSVDLLNGISDEFSILYQPNTAKGLLIRIGEAAFSKLRRKLHPLNALGSTENRLQPFEQKFESSMIQLAEILATATGISIEYESQPDQCYSLQIADGSMHVYFFAGLLRAFGTWLDSRRDYHTEVQPAETGNPSGCVRLCVRPAH